MEAVALIPDGGTILSSGMAANARASVWFWAIEQSFKNTGHPRDLTHIIVGAQGGRGRVPGTVEELGKQPGCVTKFIAGHVETLKSFLGLAEQGKVGNEHERAHNGHQVHPGVLWLYAKLLRDSQRVLHLLFHLPPRLSSFKSVS